MPGINEHIIPQTYTLVHQAGFKDVYVDTDASTLLVIWNETSVNISVDAYMDDALNNVKIIRKYSLKGFVSDVTRNKFDITPDLQLWYADIVIPQLEDAGIEKCGIILEADLKLLSSLEEISANVLKKNGVQKIPHRFFPELTEAIKWVQR